MTKRISCSAHAAGSSVTRSSLSARTVIAGIAIAVRSAASCPVSINGAAPTGGTSAVSKGGSIIATGSASTGFANNQRRRA
jgi:hypothetical protein